MTTDEQISIIVFWCSMKWLEELKAAPLPLPYGLHQKFKALIPGKSPDEILSATDNPYWWGYAEVMREFIEVLEALPKMAFKEKKATPGKLGIINP